MATTAGPQGSVGEKPQQEPAVLFFERGAHPRAARSIALAVSVLAVLGAVWWLQDGQAGGAEQSTASSVPIGAPAGLGAVEAVKVGEEAPDIALPRLDRSTWRLSEFHGKTVVLNFWATWCPPCRAEMPDLDAVAQEFQDQDVVVVGVNMSEDPSRVEQFTKALGVTFPVLLDQHGSAFARYNVVALPTTYFIDSEGTVREINIGALSDRGLEAKLRAVGGEVWR